MKHLCLALLATLAAAPALALSCIEPTVERAFTEAHLAKDVYVPVLGRFEDFTQRPDDKALNGGDRRFTARFVGATVSSRGPGPEIAVAVAVHERCLGSWCPVLPSGTEILTFLRRDAGGRYGLEINACHGNFFPGPTAVQVAALQECLRTMSCAP